MGCQRLAHDGGDGHPGVEGREGVLEHHLEIPSRPAKLLASEGQQVLLPEQHLPGGYRQKPQHRPSGGGLAAARLAHEAQGLPFVQVEGNSVHRLHMGRNALQKPRPHGEMLLQVSDVKQAVRHFAPPPSIGARSSCQRLHRTKCPGPASCRGGSAVPQRSSA